MKYIADFHLHSKYSRATSRNMDLEHLERWAKIKGIQILGTGDFTHPVWFKELQTKLQPENDGLYILKSATQASIKFILTTELSCIYTKNNAVRRIHLVTFAPNLEIVAKINQKLGEKYNLKSDGRPILGIDAKELTKILLDISPEILIVPAHAWTPWFSIFGSKSGFNSIEECFEEMTPHIFALETGLSSDPLMNWHWSYLDKYTLISNSDAHSPENLGREANIFDFPTPPTYSGIAEAIKTRKNFVSTIEFFPEEGKYHFDGHRLCGVKFNPAQTKKNKGLCPKCHKPLTVGVMYRVEELADRQTGIQPNGAPNFLSVVPLKEIIAEILGQGKQSKGVNEIYDDVLKKGGSEFNILLNLSAEELKNIAEPKLAEAILKMRRGEVFKEPGYDGVYGCISIFEKSNIIQTKNNQIKRKNKNSRQSALF